mgnify:CR=1 FL=1
MKKAFCRIIVLILMCITLISCSFTKGNTTSEIKQTVNKFVHAIKTGNIEEFVNIANPYGILVIRNYITGGYGLRGKNIRNFYKPNEISSGLIFPVDGELPVKLSELFHSTVQLGGKINNIKKLKGIYFTNKREYIQYNNIPSTKEIVNRIYKILNKAGKNYETPAIYVLDNDEFLLCEAKIINSLPVGSFVLFKKLKGDYKVIAVIDLK